MVIAEVHCWLVRRRAIEDDEEEEDELDEEDEDEDEAAESVCIGRCPDRPSSDTLLLRRPCTSQSQTTLPRYPTPPVTVQLSLPPLIPPSRLTTTLPT
jgi:hypothetical protein